MNASALLSSLGLVILTACAGDANPPAQRDTAPVAPGYHGPLPSVEAREVLKELTGRSFKDTDGAHGGGEWVVGAFGVVPNPVTGKGPVISIERRESVGTPVRYGGEDPGRRWIPMEHDADIARFYELVTGEPATVLCW
jgi:hypothetical protein